MLMVDLKNFGSIRDSLFCRPSKECRPGLMFSSASVVLLYGKSGAGKTLLTLGLYIVPMIMVEAVYRVGLSEYIEMLRRFINVDELLRCRAVFCRLGLEVDEVRNLNYDPSSIEKVCLEYSGGSVSVSLVDRGGKMKQMDINDSDVIKSGVVDKVLMQTIYTYPVPQHLISMILTMDVGKFRTIVKTVEKIYEKSKGEKGAKEAVLKLAALRVLPHISLSDSINGYRSSHRPIGFEEGVEYYVQTYGYGAYIYLTKSLGEVKQELVSVLKNLVEYVQEDVKNEDPYAIPIIVLDDGFDGLQAELALDMTRDLVKLSKNFNAKVVVATHRIEPAAEVGEVEVWVSTYGLDTVSNYFGLPKDLRIAITEAKDLPNDAVNEIAKVFGGGSGGQ